MEDDHVDRLDVQARQRVELTSTNRPIGLIALVIHARAAHLRLTAQVDEAERARPTFFCHVLRPLTLGFPDRKVRKPDRAPARVRGVAKGADAPAGA